METKYLEMGFTFDPEKDHYDISNDFEKRFDTSNYEIKRPLPIGRNKKVIGLMKDELEKVMTEFSAVRPNIYSYLLDDGNSDKMLKRIKECVMKRKLKFNNYKDCLLNNEMLVKSQQSFKSEAHNLYTEEINKIY